MRLLGTQRGVPLCGITIMRSRFFLICAVFASMAGRPGMAAESQSIVVRSVQGKFEDVKERLIFAIEERGLVVNYTAKIGDMLERTGKDIQRDRRIYAKAEVVEFCSAALSRDTMEADPHHIAFCPYAVAVYSLVQDPGRVYVSYRKLPLIGPERSRRTLRAVNDLLEVLALQALR